MWCGTRQKVAFILQQTQSIPDWLFVVCIIPGIVIIPTTIVLSTKLIMFTFLLCPLHLSHLSLFARCGGTVGAILTCPLEVVKTRLQSSSLSFYVSGVQLSTVNGPSVSRVSPPGPLHFLKWVFIICCECCNYYNYIWIGYYWRVMY